MIDVGTLYNITGVQGVLNQGTRHVALGLDPYMLTSANGTLRFCDELYERGWHVVTFLHTSFGEVAIVRPRPVPALHG